VVNVGDDGDVAQCAFDTGHEGTWLVLGKPKSLPSFHVKTVKFLEFSMSCASDRRSKPQGTKDVKKLLFFSMRWKNQRNSGFSDQAYPLMR
jgi:hypothetical protein